MSADLPAWIVEEEDLVARGVPALVALREADREREVRLVREGRELEARLKALRGDPLQRRALEEAVTEKDNALKFHRKAHRANALDVASPWFAHVRLREERTRDVLLGKATVTDASLPAPIVDWREAPISRLYYEYDEGDEYCEEIAGREREGTVEARRALDIRGRVLQEVRSGERIARKRAGPRWEISGPAAREIEEDHRLPEILALITAEQFDLISRPKTAMVLLRGCAGSGKTTVALHRVSFLAYQDPRRFDPKRVLVVMYNKALQGYVRRALDELGVEGPRVETFHGWALAMLRNVGVRVDLAADPPAAVRRLKRHPGMDALVRRYVVHLGERLAEWVDVGADLRAKWASTPGTGFEKLSAFWPRLSPTQLEDVEGLRRQIEARIRDHGRDLYALFEDPDLCREVLPSALHRSLPAARRRAEQLADRGQADWEDAALLLRLAQLKARLYPRVSCPFLDRYHHVLVDEAQDLSLVEIAALVEASDPRRSVTIAGDPAQAIYQEVSEADFDAFLGGLAGSTTRVDVLPIGHRSTRPIMALAEEVLGRSGEAVRGRDGAPVRWLRDGEATAETVSAEVAAWRAPREQSLVAVVARTRKEADRWAKSLQAAGLDGVRRAERDEFRFEPGVVVTNAHQVKGLEFDGVVTLDPAAYPERERKLLHVVLTRAVEQLWVVAPRGLGAVLSVLLLCVTLAACAPPAPPPAADEPVERPEPAAAADEPAARPEPIAEVAPPPEQVDRVVAAGGRPRTEPIRLVVLHATGGPSCDPSIAFHSGTLDGIVDYFETRDDGVSIHYVVGRDGTVVGMVPEDRVANHVLGHNEDSVGIELVNRGDGEDPYVEAQLAALRGLVGGVLLRNGLAVDAVTTHAALDHRFIECTGDGEGGYREEVNLEGRGFARSQDPGANFPLEAFREQVSTILREVATTPP